ncbi:uncharacterized protein LOC112567236 [Pomacea canaliculata]|uniref:uncharacterized protein LOC112567236 n=1 Tax=Pomacea canaliculata TaxID=400727 RepID=UPI000D73E375|nr:uncharacterized protein LOC112567236 [Pomacea canaliculata]
MDKMFLQAGILCFLGLISFGWALECYVCTDQFDNRDKCIKTSVQCREEEDACLSMIVWRAPGFWTPRSEKINIISKRCGTNAYCSQRQRELGLRCMRDWYKDWECLECCQGDRCNFYVTLGASSATSSMVLLLTTLILIWFLHH